MNSSSNTETESSNENYDMCVICQENMLESEDVYVLPECSHSYHTNCIMHWFRAGKNFCPLCNCNGVNHEACNDWTENMWDTITSNHVSFGNTKMLLMSYSNALRDFRNNKSNKVLKRKIKTVKMLEKRLIKYKKEFRDWKNSYANNDKISNILKKEQNYYTKCMKKSRDIRHRKMFIGALQWKRHNIIVAEKISI